jgi:hypothetical protein
MANYKELEGFGVQTLATDPDTPGWVGSIFYNSTSGTFKTVKPGGAPIGTWASGGKLNTARGLVRMVFIRYSNCRLCLGWMIQLVKYR